MKDKKLDHISPDLISRNPDNPRLIFRANELDTLLDSIRNIGIEVPLSVFEDKKKYILLDGERRWLCAKKLNFQAVPAIIEPKPSRLENILKMFNIHNVRVQWDLYSIALKLGEVRKLLTKEHKQNTDKDLAVITGVSLATVKRAFSLLELPSKYLNLLREELKKPKSEQTFSEDFFIEMTKAIRAIERHTPMVIKEHPAGEIMDSFVRKYKLGIIKNVTSFRKVSKIVRSESAGIRAEEIHHILDKLIVDPNYSIEAAYQKSVAEAYEDRDLKRLIGLVIERLRVIKKGQLKQEIKTSLKDLHFIIRRLINEI